MRCQVCSAETAEGASFCQDCGAKLGGAGSASTMAPASGDSHHADPGAALGRRRGQDTPEKTLWEGDYSPKAMMGIVILATFVSIALVVAAVALAHWYTPLALIAILWFYLAGRYAVRRIGIHYRLTNHMLYHDRGVLTRRTDRIEAIDINDVTYEQGPIERMTGVGRVRIRSSDKTDPEFYVEGIEDVQRVAKMIDDARRAERIRRGVSVESLGGGGDAGDVG